jgi:hypothetical protein
MDQDSDGTDREAQVPGNVLIAPVLDTMQAEHLCLLARNLAQGQPEFGCQLSFLSALKR